MITAINCKRMFVWASSCKKKCQSECEMVMPPSPSIWSLWFNRIFVTAFTDRNELVELCHSVAWMWLGKDFNATSEPFLKKIFNTENAPLAAEKGAVSRCSWLSLEFEHYVIQGSHKIILLPFEMGPLAAISSHPKLQSLEGCQFLPNRKSTPGPSPVQHISTHRHIKNDKSHDC